MDVDSPEVDNDFIEKLVKNTVTVGLSLITYLILGPQVMFGVVLGIFAYLGYKVKRAISSDGWDDSNILNVLRTESHLAAHPEDFGKMWYLNERAIEVLKGAGLYEGIDFERPFYYISKDEFSENFPGSRP